MTYEPTEAEIEAAAHCIYAHMPKSLTTYEKSVALNLCYNLAQAALIAAHKAKTENDGG